MENTSANIQYVTIQWEDFAKACLKFISLNPTKFSPLPSDFIEWDWLEEIRLIGSRPMPLHQMYCLVNNTTAATIIEAIDTWAGSNKYHNCLHTCGNGSIVVKRDGKYFLETCTVIRRDESKLNAFGRAYGDESS
jgi:hypothetical protein